MAVYKDFFIRDNLADTGNEPVTSFYVSHSPDIIPVGDATLSTSELVSGWTKGTPVPQDLNALQFNNIYLRTKNLYNGANTGKAYLYWMDPTLMAQPTKWSIVPNNETKGGQKLDYGTLKASAQGQVTPTSQPFTFYIKTGMPKHFCFVAFIKGSHDTRTFPTTDWTDWRDFVRWVKNNANVGWHNVNILTEVPSENKPVSASMYNPNKMTTPYGIKAIWQNFPNGTQVFLYTLKDDAHGFPGFNQSATIVNGSPKDLWGICDFPAGYATTVFAYAVFPGGVVPSNAKLTLTSHGPANSESEEDQEFLTHGFDPSELGFDSQFLVYGDSTMFVPIASVTSNLPQES